MEIGTLQELNVQPGDVVQYRGEPTKYVVAANRRVVDAESGELFNYSAAWGFSIVSRATPTEPADQEKPKLWRDMSGAEKGGLLLAHHEGAEIEWLDKGIWVEAAPNWVSTVAYRVRPVQKQPVVETVRLLTGKAYGWLAEPEDCCGSQNTHRITLTIIDGVVQPTATVEVL